MILITSIYPETNPSRQDEYLKCLQRNLENDYLDEIHLFLEDQSNSQEWVIKNPLFASSKLHLIPRKGRSRYSDLIRYANLHLPKDARVIISNADIYFDRTLMQLKGHDLTARLLCLSRWNVQADGSSVFFEHPGSQDAWVFQTPMRQFFCDFPLGVPGCDNRLAWEAEQAGLVISNPGRSIRIHHLHLSQVRHYSERQRISGPTRAIPAIFLDTNHQVSRKTAPNKPSAEVAFSESMGYTIARLELGVSSHNNELRPFTHIPSEITGFLFTQVVAYAVSPIEVRFLTSGKLFVLVGNDWDGYGTATEWLSQAGFREDLKLVETQYGMGFEVWSLVAEAGQCFTIPTQVMLASHVLIKNNNGIQPSSKLPKTKTEIPLFALTSLSPVERNISKIRKCIKSWRDAGLQIRAFNHPNEIRSMAKLYDVEFVPTTETSAQIFGKPFIPIKVMLKWAAEQDVPILIINSDIEIKMTAWEIKRIRWLAESGVCYFIRYNHDIDSSLARPEPFGIDAFLLHGKNVALFPDSFLCMGQPFWDYWIPHTFASHNRPIYSVDFPVAFHQNHFPKWSREAWHRCALEFSRVADVPMKNMSFESCMTMSLDVRRSFDRNKISLRQSPVEIRKWVQDKFGSPDFKTFLELGAHQGTDTRWMAELPNVKIHAFEPDPRNTPMPLHNVSFHRAAVADHDGFSSLILSQLGWGQEWTYSSSIKRPKNHLTRFPVAFGNAINVRTVTLDRFCLDQGLDIIDFIWADIQGAEEEMIRGGRQTLARTRYLYTEYSDDELYEDQINLQGILDLLPDFQVIELWEENVLLENRNLKVRE